MFRTQHWPRLGLAFVSGLVLALAFPKFDLPWLAWLAPGFILCIACDGSPGRVLAAGFAAGMGRFLVSLYWLLCIPFPWHGLAAFLGLSAVLSGFMAGWCWLCWKTLPTHAGADKVHQIWPKLNGRQRFLWPLFCAAAWVTMEMTVARIMTGFPWNLLGASQYHFLALIQITSVTGIYGISFLIVWLSVAVAGGLSLFRAGKSFSAALVQIAPPALALIVTIVFGLYKLGEPQDNTTRTLKIALVQPAIAQPVIWDPNEKTNRFLKLIELSRTALAENPDLLIWPEAAMPDLFTRNRFTQQTVASLLHSHYAWLLMGASDSRPKKDAAQSGELEWFNSAFLINPAGDLVARYNKKHLVIFGEYMPLARQFPFLKHLRTAGAGLSPGNQNISFETTKPSAKFSVLICAEEIFAHDVCERVEDDTDFLVNLTNDGWFGESAAQWQHAATALFRAVENHLPLVRCTNNGLTCWVDAHGRLHDLLADSAGNVYGPGFEIINLPLSAKGIARRATFYRQHGDWFGWSCVGLTAALWCAAIWKRK